MRLFPYTYLAKGKKQNYTCCLQTPVRAVAVGGSGGCGGSGASGGSGGSGGWWSWWLWAWVVVVAGSVEL